MLLEKERRRRQRIDVALAIRLVYNKERVFAKTKNISVLGTYLETDKMVPAGIALDIKIRIPKADLARFDKSKQICCEGIAFRCQPLASGQVKKQYGIGIFFRSFLKGTERDLSKYVEYILLQEKRKRKISIHKRKQKH